MPISAIGNKGFSLIELLVVLTIMTAGMLAIAAAMPQFRPASTLESSATEIAATMRKARTLAITRASTVTVSVDRASRHYGIDGEGRMHSLPTSLEVAWRPRQSRLEIRFHPDGTARGSTLSLSDGRERVKIFISPLTGRVALK